MPYSQSIFYLSKMDCPGEEQLVRLALEPLQGISALQFDLEKRQVIIDHSIPLHEIQQVLVRLQLGARLNHTGNLTAAAKRTSKLQAGILTRVLLINAVLFLVEIFAGLLVGSMGLIADSLDMLADAFVYGLSLYAIGHSQQRQGRIARISGYFQLGLAVLGMMEVVRRYLGMSDVPDVTTMVGISALALIGNTASLILLQKQKDSGAHMKASWIFTSNDIIINFSVMVAAALVYYFNSPLPDLIIGTFVFVIVIRGAMRIFKITRPVNQ
jgi:Co/Zn/Cd efflux system component